MADDQNQGEKPDQNNATSTSGTGSTVMVDLSAQSATVTEDAEGQLPEAVKAVLKKERDKARQEEKLRKAAEAKVQEMESANLSEKEKAERERDAAVAQADEAKAQAREAILRATVLESASEFRNPALALEIVRSKIEYDDDGEPQNVTEALGELLAAEPYMKRGASDVGATNPERNQGPAIKQDDLKNMTPEQISAARAKGDLDHLLGVA